ncbi:conserved hypothetical protein [Acinetobacter proteolyticus]|uniref:Uncharacterized protein n=1 Tax=Acinetobacter proteolyticus TaxID=1776741 RepID=A0A653K576_9GAMM|nr:hypothetical protein [Acinetobacter proteolyticus]VXA55452.1 conserved hypothetical protein [Acinetobacter proteolyticus]
MKCNRSECLVSISSDLPCFWGYAGPEECEYGVKVKERPISRRRKRKLSKQGKNVYWSKRLEQYVYVMGDKA